MNLRRFATCVFSLIGVLTAPSLAQTSILLADDTKMPRVQVSWPLRDGKVADYSMNRRFESPGRKSSIGPNIDCYIALGGTRLDKGLADPKGALIQIGLYKKNASKPFFENIADNSSLTIALRGVVMSQPAVPRHKTAMMHLRYMMEDLKACGLSGDSRNLFNTADPHDPILAKAAGGSVRPGCLDGKSPEHGSVEAKVEADGSVSITFTVPYALLRHIQDPYQRTNPGGFFEPNHFHVEIELIPAAAAESGKTAPEAPTSPAPPSPPPANPEPAKPKDPVKPEPKASRVDSAGGPG